MSKKIGVSIIVAIALAGVAVIFYLIFTSGKNINKNSALVPVANAPLKNQIGNNKNQVSAPQLIKPDGKTDDIVSNVVGSVEAEDNLINQEEAEAQMTADDSQDLNNLSQSYDSN